MESVSSSGIITIGINIIIIVGAGACESAYLVVGDQHHR